MVRGLGWLCVCLEVRGQWCLLLKPVRDCSALGEKILSHWMARRERSSHYIKVRAIIYGYYMEESWGEMMNDEWWTLPWRLYLLIFLSSFLQELKAHILPLTNVAFDKSGSRYVYLQHTKVWHFEDQEKLCLFVVLFFTVLSNALQVYNWELWQDM